MPPSEAPEIPAAIALPVALTRFIGRERELEELARLVGTTRLLTLTGAGGSGKTRLAQEVAARTAGEFETTFWIDMAPLVDPALLGLHVAVGLEVGERPGASTVEAITAAIGTRRVLIVFDNCEHVVDPCAGLAEYLLTRCPALAILATSREALGVQGETAWLVPPLATGEAVQLFVERARQVVPTFDLGPASAPAVHDICQRLDGIPLAIELAAARIRVLSPDQIAARLSDALRLLSAGSRTALPRHRTLRGTLDWSFALLSEPEQRLLERLSVFSGTFSIEAAEAVGESEALDAGDILDAVATLVDKSLVLHQTMDQEARYRLLETVRQYAEERLKASGQWEECRLRHADYYLAGVEAAAPAVFGGAASPIWISRLSNNIGNLRAAMEWAAERPERADYALRFGWSLHWYWFCVGHFEEGRKQLTAALRQAAGVDPVVLAKARLALGHIGIWQGQRQGVRPLMEQAVATLEHAGDPHLLAYAINGVGASLVFEGDPVAAAPWFERAIVPIEHAPPHVLHSLIRYWRAWAARERGEFDLARISLIEASHTGRQIDHPPAVAHPLALLGQFDVAAGRPVEALGYFAQSLPVHGRIGDAWGIGRGLEGGGAAAGLLGLGEDSARLLAAAEALRERNVTPLSTTEQDDHQAAVQRARDALGARFEDVWQAGRSLPVEQAIALALEVARARGTAPDGTPAAPAPAAPVPGEPTLRVRAMGPLQVFTRGIPVEPGAWGSARPRELLVFLLCHPQGVSREQVGAALWPDSNAGQVRNSFHVTLHRLRRALGEGEWIAVTQDRYRLAPGVTAELDADRFETEVAAALAAPRDGEGWARRLAAALDRWGGEFLAGEPAGAWRRPIAERLEARYQDGLLALSAWYLDRGEPGPAIDACRRIVALKPLHEEAWRRLIVAQAMAGDRTQALRSYRQLADLLASELDSTPDQASRALLASLEGGGPLPWPRG